ncbi:FAD-binding oxidoreductase [Candidatus Roizmanbacteria bacterium CG10_big_fil_rev_8_21_14_0_10_39_6]|uniref:FAD-binding oxidoreductase n=1 Tax=Candidatus Roizmanbacteria bacterium CG10_big_fil_rev_8_21_14_0_10_39_6 TaxID=1974853 RepID=A0A2M8KRQ4_9BACT|nr:MAG: FAD-binding oxidoreductase [Candidatus Roizmanbacteria bacterium CG10_big_fil_rev_8_21_14_0_10_39_6]
MVKKLDKVRLTLFLLVISLVSWSSYKVITLTGEPGKDKDCDPLFKEKLDKKTTLQWVQETIINWVQKGGFINDASCVDKTSIYGIVSITDENDIKDALQFAKANDLKVSLAGAKHSMGGHAFSQGNLVLDMTSFDTVIFDKEKDTVKVQSGATWHEIQEVIHPTHAIMAMQSTDIFTVGGSISVNAHGMDHQAGAVENSIISMRVMLADGSVKTISRTENTELYEHVVGGYGLFAIILEVTLRVVPNDLYKSSREFVDYKEFNSFYVDQIAQKEDVGLTYTHLSTAPGPTFLREGLVYVYTKSNETVRPQEIPPLGEVSSVKLRRLMMNVSKKGDVWQKIRWWSEKYLEPKMESCSISRNDAQVSGEACLVTRNEPMHDSVPYLKNSLKKETDILHEYFIPRDEFVSFIDGMRDIMETQDINLLNASIRVVNAEKGALTYAPVPAYSVVLYINQDTSEEGHKKMEKVTRDLVDLTVTHHGRFFLPYQLHYTAEQLKSSYPEISEFFRLKEQYDSSGLFTNTWYERYKEA